MAQNDLVIRLGADAGQYALLKRDVESNQALYDSLLQRLKEARVSAGLQSNNIQIIDRAEVPREPSSPDVALNSVLGVTIGLSLGLLAAFLRDYTDRSLASPRDVRSQLGLPALSLIPRLPELTTDAPSDPGGPARLLGLRRQSADASLAELSSDRTQNRPAGWQEHRKFSCWEHYRSLRTWLLLSARGETGHTVLVTSAVPGEGKTTTSLNLAVSLAKTGANTILVELDIHRPQLARLLGLGSDDGFSEHFRQRDDVMGHISETTIPNLYALTAGPDSSCLSEMMGSRAMQETLSRLSERFQYVVIDSPPVLMTTDAVVISTMVDGVVLVIRGDQTPVDTIREAQHQLDRVGAKVHGAVVNDVSRATHAYGYYSSYQQDDPPDTSGRRSTA